MSRSKDFPPAPIEFTPEQREGIDPGDLDNDRLNALIAPFFNSQKDDQIEVWLGTSQAENSGAYQIPAFYVSDPEDMTPVYFAGDKLREHDGTSAFFGYRINGNELSFLVQIPINLSRRRAVK